MANNQHLLEMSKVTRIDLVCFSHLRWDFVYQRPQHLMSRFVKQFRTFFVEEPIFHSADDCYHIKLTEENVWVVSLHLNEYDMDRLSVITRQKTLINLLFLQEKIEKYIAWYYTPMALKITTHLKPEMIIYDCMDE